MSDNTDNGDEFAPDEAARRRDEVVRRMANAPPQPRTKQAVARMEQSEIRGPSVNS